MLSKNKKNIFLNILYIPFKCAPFYSLFIAILKLLDGIIPSLQIIIIAKFIDNINKSLSNKQYTNIYIYIILIIIFIGYLWLSIKLSSFLEIKLEISLRNYISLEIINKQTKLEYKYIEDPLIEELICRISDNTEIKLKDGYLRFLKLVSLILKVLGILLILIFKIWWAPIIILIISLPLFYLSIKSGKSLYSANVETSKYKIRYQYLSDILTDRNHVYERTLFNFSEYVNKKWNDYFNKYIKINLRTEAKFIWKIEINSIITTFISFCIIIVLIKPLTLGYITSGMFISLSTSIISLIKVITSQLLGHARELSKTKEFLNELQYFFNLDEISNYNDSFSNKINFNIIEFKNVKFKYPNSNNYILNGINLTIEKGKHYAFIGVNGSGKTTLIKLLSGLYSNYEGEILIDGINLKTLPYYFINSLSSIIYQDFSKYSISLKDNIGIGNINKLGSHSNDALISKAIDLLELTSLIKKLPNGVNTILGETSSYLIDISLGEWQKIAIARSTINPAPLKIMDEPTASLDPISESKLYEKFKIINHNKTVIFISHRLGSTKLADKIFVLNNGKIYEEGTHNELLSKNDLYANMYTEQKGWYE